MQRITWLLFVNFETSLQQSYDAENNPHWPRQSTPIDTGSNHNWISSGAQAAFSGAVYSARAGAVAGAMAGTVAGIGAAVILPAYLVAHTIRRALNPPTNYGNRFPNQNQLTSEGSIKLNIHRDITRKIIHTRAKQAMKLVTIIKTNRLLQVGLLESSMNR